MASKHTDIDSYLSDFPAEVQAILNTIRAKVKAAIPDAQETISYNMPALKLRRTFFYFAAFKHHIGIYPPVKHDTALINELLPYANEKGNLRFPFSEPIPYELITRVAVVLAAENAG
jgi:uncharacterized protein YdhG (YjbR/CyaY superfamily)